MITIILPISRTDYLKPVFDCLINLDKPNDTELIIITDGDENLERAVDRRLDSVSFAKIQIVSYGEKPATTINERRYRIADIHNKAKYYVNDKCEYVFLIEDDTTYPPNTLNKFINIFKNNSFAGYVEGVQLGRHNSPYVGAWVADDLINPTEINSVMPQDKALSKIDAGGFYCALTRASLYKTHHFEPLDKVGLNGLSCDVNFGFYVRNMEYECYIDWTVQCDHIGERGSVNLGNTKPCQVQFKKDEDDKWICVRV